MGGIILGAVAYDPKVVTIWEGFRVWFAEQGLDFDYVLFSNYERQVRAHFDGVVNVAWNSPLAWLEAERVAAKLGRKATAVAMRDTDCDLTSVIVARADSPIASIEDLRGKTLAVGASDSPQATLIPLGWLAQHGLEPGRDVEIVRHEIAVGMHGDHVGGERHAARDLVEGRVDAAAMIDGNHLAFGADGTLPSGSTRIVTQTPVYDHCNFTVLDGADPALIDRFVGMLLAQSFEDPVVRPLLEMEGLKQWKPGRVHGDELLDKAVDHFDYLSPFLSTFE